ncbi:MAG: chromosome segregation protein SMC, partial [Methylophilaceae bacterium]|nr:chromosome segregation protein SMC [Methylophilaceae bacterium]
KKVVEQEQAITELRRQEQQQSEAIKTLRDQQQEAQRHHAQLEAQVHSLQKIQQSIGHEAKLDDWLKSQGLHETERLWQKITISTGWETALEAVLGARLNAILQPEAYVISETRPPANIVLAATGKDDGAATKHALQPLASVIEHNASELAGVLQEWLDGVFLAESAKQAIELRKQLKSGQRLVTQAGDIYTRYSLSMFSPQSALHGVLERQRELDVLQSAMPKAQAKVLEITAQHQQAEERASQLRQDLHTRQQTLRAEQQSIHQLTLDIQRQEQQIHHALERQHAISQEIETLQGKIESANAHKVELKNKIESATQQLPELKHAMQVAQEQREREQVTLNRARQSIQNAEHALQEKVFNKKLIDSNINQIRLNIDTTLEEIQSLKLRQKESMEMLDAAKMEGLKTNLERALLQKQQRETALAEARNRLTHAENELQDQERNRMQNEQMLHPLRDKLEQSRLAEQEARLNFEQCQTELETIKIEEHLLAEDLPTTAKANELESKVSKLGQDMDELGPVNLAAIQELSNERERKAYLDSQSLDLNQAIATLEDAIRRIDKETRSRLQNTFDEANRHFAELFSLLFGGGQARLELLGEEILDTGMQVFAQPPGKKNSTIHLLSGGEKALTALALVFALFRLNPAPFCLMDEVDAPLDDSNTERFCNLVKKMSERTQFLFVSHNKITMEMAQQLIG